MDEKIFRVVLYTSLAFTLGTLFLDLPQNTISSSVVSNLLLIFIPIFIGRPIVYVLLKEKEYILPLYWMMGVIVVFLMMYGISIITTFDFWIMKGICVPIMLSNIFLYKDAYVLDYFRDRYLIIVIIGGLLSAAIIRMFSPFPYFISWDCFQDMYVVGNIIENNNIYLFLSSYSQNIFLIGTQRIFLFSLALVSDWIKIHPFYIHWPSIFFIIMLYAVNFYIIAKRIVKKYLALIITIMTSFMILYTNTSGLVDLRSQTVMLVLIPIILFYSFNNTMNGCTRDYYKIIMIIIIFTALVHIFNAIIIFPIILYNLIIKNDTYYKKIKLLSAIGLILIIVLALYLNYYGLNIGIFNTSGTTSRYFDLIVKYNYVGKHFTSLVVIISMLLGTLSFFKQDKIYHSISLISICLVVSYFLPVEFSARIIVFLPIFLPLLIAKVVELSEQYSKMLPYISIILILGLFIPYSINNTHELLDKNYYGPDDLVSSFSASEYDAAFWMYNNIENGIIVSDPITQHIVSGIAYLDNFGGTYTPQDIIVQLKLLKNTDKASLISLLKNDVSIGSTEVYYIVSGRTIAWFNSSQDKIWHPIQLKDDDILEGFLSDENYELLYHNEEVYVFRVL